MISKKNTLKQLKNTYCRLMPSKIQGIGIFAIRDIPAGVKPFRDAKKEHWHQFKLAELKNLDKEVLKMVKAFFIIEKDGTFVMPDYGLNGMDISFFLNHSNKPNIKTTDEGFTFKTIRKIRKGEELTIAYETFYGK